MKKRKKTGFFVFAIVMALIVLTVLTVVISGTCTKKYSKETHTKALENWMQDIKDDALLTDIVIPGSHDSGTYTMPYFTKTQYYTVEEQLLSGVRYFDIRVRNKDEKCVIYHSFSNGPEAETLIESFALFLKMHPTEFLILDFQHFDNAKEKVLELVDRHLKDLAAFNSTGKSDTDFISELTAGDMRGKCLILFGEGNAYTDRSYIFARNNDEGTCEDCSLNSFYFTELNGKTSSTYVTEVLPYYIELNRKKTVEEGIKVLFVLQGQLTDTKLVFGPYSREKRHEDNMSNYLESLPESEDFSEINIIIRDFINDEKALQIVNLNREKGTVK